jgi:hypothetical protein
MSVRPPCPLPLRMAPAAPAFAVMAVLGFAAVSRLLPAAADGGALARRSAPAGPALPILLVVGLAAMAATSGAATSPQWQPVPLMSASIRDAGISPGGEGAQWPQGLAVDSRDGNFLLFGTDVGGIYRSLDAGRRWEPCNVGYTPRGNSGFAIDPNDPDCCLAVGANSAPGEWHGLYLSTDRAASWRHVLPQNYRGYRDYRDQIAYDPTTAADGRSMVVYYSSNTGAFFRSEDGGETWQELAEALGRCHLQVHPTRGILYAAGAKGFGRSANRAASFAITFQGEVRDLSVSPAAPDCVWLLTGEALWLSTDAGATFARIEGEGLPTENLQFAKVSPVDAGRILVFYQGPNWDWRRYCSRDGGRTWDRATFDNSLAFLPYNSREALFAWHPTDPDVVWSFGGDWITRSDDGGARWHWAGNGYNGVLIGGGFNFSAQDPDVMFFGSQDYNGAITTDGGVTWTYTNISGHAWGGFCYGGYASSAQVMFTGDADSWRGERRLMVSSDGGRSFGQTGVTLSGPNVSCGNPKDPSILFAYNHRSTDGGRTWQLMEGCDAVFTFSPAGERELYGASAGRIVRSDDSGATWQVVVELPNRVSDVAVDHVRGRVYAASRGQLYRWDGATLEPVETPTDQRGNRHVASVAVDPVDPAIVYAANRQNLYCSAASAVRSTDAGVTWEVLTRNTPLDGTGLDGGREAIWVRVNPRTRDAWFSTSCYGIWKMPAPGR